MLTLHPLVFTHVRSVSSFEVRLTGAGSDCKDRSYLGGRSFGLTPHRLWKLRRQLALYPMGRAPQFRCLAPVAMILLGCVEGVVIVMFNSCENIGEALRPVPPTCCVGFRCRTPRDAPHTLSPRTTWSRKRTRRRGKMRGRRQRRRSRMRRRPLGGSLIAS